jgi:membrane protease YdiL (CAAX protease family)
MIASIERRRIYIFVAIAYAISIVLAVAVYLNGGIFARYPLVLKPLALTLMMVLMFAPTIANLLTRLITREGWSNLLLWPKFRHGWPYYVAALFLPSLAAVLGGAVYYLLFPAHFDASMTYARDNFGMVPLVTTTNIWTFLLIMIPLFPLLSLVTLYLPFGEEFGWRAYLLPKLMPLGGRKAVLLVGVIWAVWHWPFVFMGYEYGFGYWGAPVVGPLLWIGICLLLSTVTGWLALRSSSVWPAAIGHGVINATAGLSLYFLATEPNSLVGPQPVGIIGVAGYLILAALIFFNPRALAPMAKGAPPVAPKPVQAPVAGAA